MKLATGIAALFLTVGVGIHSVLLLSFDAIGFVVALVALLFLFGGAFAFQVPHVASNIFTVAFVVAFLTGLAANGWMFWWAILAMILAVMSNETAKREAKGQERIGGELSDK